MATKQGQRIAIWVIAAIMVIGTLGSFLIIALSSHNAKIDEQIKEELLAEYQAEYAQYREKVDQQARELSEKYYQDFVKYENRVGKFKAEDVKDVSFVDLKQGGGLDITEYSAYSAYYIGWNPNGKIFDQSIEGESLKAPIEGVGLIPGWNEGVLGMRIGGVREITIPASKAYGEAGSGELIEPNMPLRFLIMAIESPEPILEPQPSDRLLRYFNN